SENKIYAFTYSPTRSAPVGEFETDDSSQFVLDYDMAGSPFTAIAANSNVASGSNTTAAYGGLILGAQYEWYATANDGKTTTTGPTWSFTAAATANTPPVAANDAFVVNEDEILNVSGAGVLGNDSDADGDSLHAVLVSVPSHGALTLNGDGSFSYAPNANYNGPDSFTYKANDGSADSNVGTVSITVNAVNDAPVASNQAVVTDEDTAKAITLSASDVEGSALTYTIGTGPTHGTLSGIAPALTYRPAANYNGPDSFTFTANAHTRHSHIAAVPTTPTPRNAELVASNQAVVTDEDTAKAITLGASDVEGSALTYTIGTGPTHGTLSGIAPALTYTPAANY